MSAKWSDLQQIWGSQKNRACARKAGVRCIRGSTGKKPIGHCLDPLVVFEGYLLNTGLGIHVGANFGYSAKQARWKGVAINSAANKEAAGEEGGPVRNCWRPG